MTHTINPLPPPPPTSPSPPAIAFTNGTTGGIALFLFAGGRQQLASGPSDVVDIFNVRTGLWSANKLSVARADLAAAALPLQVTCDV
jgi:hypothetical protein